MGIFIKGHKHSEKTIKKISETKLKNSKYRNLEAICKNCDIKFIFRENKHHKTRSFCSKKCLLEKGSRSGIPLSEESRKKLSKKYTGKGNPSWKSGLSKERNKVYRGAKYRKFRTEVFERDNYTCQLCGVRNGNGKRVDLEADHIKPWCECKDGWFDINNCRTLCKECHKEVTREYMKKNWKNQYY